MGVWPDSSGRGNHFFSTGKQRPTARQLRSTRGQPVLRFDGVDDGMFCNKAFSLTRPYTCFIVNRCWAKGGESKGRTLQSRTLNWCVGLYAGQHGHYTGRWVGRAPAKNRWWISCCVGTDEASAYFANGRPHVDNVSKPPNPGGLTLNGGYGCYREFRHPDVAEVIVYDRALTDDERRTVEAHLSAKFGIAVEAGDGGAAPIRRTWTLTRNGEVVGSTALPPHASHAPEDGSEWTLGARATRSRAMVGACLAGGTRPGGCTPPSDDARVGPSSDDARDGPSCPRTSTAPQGRRRGRGQAGRGAALAFERAQFRGEMAEVRVWSRRRAPGEIRKWHRRAVNPRAPGLAAQWDFAAGCGSVLHEAVGPFHAMIISGDKRARTGLRSMSPTRNFQISLCSPWRT